MEWGLHGGVLLHGASGRLAGEGRTGSGPAALGAALARDNGPTRQRRTRSGSAPKARGPSLGPACSRLPRKAHPSNSGLLGHPVTQTGRLSPNAAAAAAAAEPGRQGMGL